MYLIITEFGDVTKVAEVTEADLEAANSGAHHIIDISVPDEPKDYYEEWVPVPFAK